MKKSHSRTDKPSAATYWVAESRRRSSSRDWSYSALQVYCSHIIEAPEDPDGFRRAAQCFLADGPTAAAVLFSYAVLELAPGDGRTERIVANHAQAAPEVELWKWVDRSADEIVLLGILSAMKTAEMSGRRELRNERARITRHLGEIAPECSNSLFLSELRNVRAITRAEERDGNLIGNVRRDGITQGELPSNSWSGPKRKKLARVRLWTGADKRRK